MLGAPLGNFQGKVAGIHHSLLHTVHFVSEHEGVLAPGFAPESVQLHRMDGLLHGNHRVSLSLEVMDKCIYVLHMLEGDHFLGPEGDFPQLGRRRHGADAAQEYLVHSEGIGRPEGRTHIVRAADVVQHQDGAAHRPFQPILLRAHPAQLDIEKFSVFHNAKVRDFAYICRIGNKLTTQI